MGIDYMLGFRDAADLLVEETDKIIEGVETGSYNELAHAMDAFIATAYILKLHADKLEDEVLENMEEEINCSNCDLVEECNEYNNTIDDYVQFINSIFEDTKEEF